MVVYFLGLSVLWGCLFMEFSVFMSLSVYGAVCFMGLYVYMVVSLYGLSVYGVVCLWGCLFYSAVCLWGSFLWCCLIAGVVSFVKLLVL